MHHLDVHRRHTERTDYGDETDDRKESDNDVQNRLSVKHDSLLH